jgi:hypothetical protein
MKNICAVIVCFSLGFGLKSQEVKTYKGLYGSGFAEYGYAENDKFQRVMAGPFKYSDTAEIADRGECVIQISGNYRDDKKAGPWVASVKSTDNSSNETVTGMYLNGQKTGFWSHRLTVTEMETKSLAATFNRNKFKGVFNYKFSPLVPQSGYKSIEIAGNFDNEGRFDGEWKVNYASADGGEFEDILRFQHGVLAFRLKREVSSQEMERYDKEAFVASFFKNMNSKDSSSLVDGKKYGLQRSSFKHEIIIPVLKSLQEPGEIVSGYLSPLTTSIIAQGEIFDQSYLNNSQEIIDWDLTPKGKAELLERQRIEREYNAQINDADAALKAKKLEDALRMYRLASTIKMDELYPTEQVSKVEEMIKVRNRKNRLLESIEEKEKSLDSEQKRMLGIEDFEKKQKHLFEAYNLSFDYLERKLKSDNSRVKANIANNLMDATEVSDLEAYETDLAFLLDFQKRVSKLIGSDTKELEKELKKLEDPKAIVARLKA